MKKTDEFPYSNTSVVLVFHEYATGPPHALMNFLRRRVSKLFVIAHPFVFSKDKRSHNQLFINGKIRHISHFHVTFSNQVINAMKDVIMTLYWVIRHGPFDLYIGVDGLNAWTGLILKSIKMITSVVYYVIDYVPKRFDSSLLNAIYHQIDFFSVKNSCITWNLHSIMAEMRYQAGLDEGHKKKQLVVPVGTEHGILKQPQEIRYKLHAVHMGHLTEKQGVQLLINSIPSVLKIIPKFHLDIFGSGEYEKFLQQLARTIDVSHHITFHGYVSNHSDLIQRLSQRAIAIAPYIDSKDNFVQYTDSGKVKAYLSAGLPVVVTKVPPIWKDIEGHKCGIACESTSVEIARSIILLLSDQKILHIYRKNAFEYGKKFRWDMVFNKAFDDSRGFFNYKINS